MTIMCDQEYFGFKILQKYNIYKGFCISFVFPSNLSYINSTPTSLLYKSFHIGYIGWEKLPGAKVMNNFINSKMMIYDKNYKFCFHMVFKMIV